MKKCPQCKKEIQVPSIEMTNTTDGLRVCDDYYFETLGKLVEGK